MRVAGFSIFRDGGSDTGRRQCVAVLRQRTRGPWMIFATRGASRRWGTEPDSRGDSYGPRQRQPRR